MKLRKMLLATLLAGSMVISGCKAPAKPVLTAYPKDEMVCFSNKDASQLGLYILSLESGYK